jgi:HNH endonuclease
VSDYISETLRTRIRTHASNRCGYCRSHQKYVWGTLEIEHIIPKAKGGSNTEDNLWLACRPCNGYKSDQTHAIDPITADEVILFNPRTQRWAEHFAWSDDGVYIVGLTACGRATVRALQMNSATVVTVRQAWVSVGWHPPTEN